jgi:hypothetical protein
MSTGKPMTDFRQTAFEIILKESLSINSDDHQPLTVIYDDDFLPMFDSFLAVVTRWNIPAAFLYIPKQFQDMLVENKHFLDENNQISLPPQILGAVQSSNLIITFLNGDSKYSKVRGAIIGLRKQYACKMVHSPGITDEVLKICTQSPFGKIHKESELVAWALGNANKCKITSWDRHGKEYFLKFNMDGWDNEPFMSSGRIFDNSWGNIPPGESFCCPDLHSVYGQICINGSAPGYLLAPHEEVILEFKQGKLINRIPHGKKITEYFTILENDANRREDKHWNSLAEFGVGLNPAIKKPVGNSLFDEKMAGTIHIAIGGNTSFGHGLNSYYHDDLVCLRPTVELDSYMIMHKGKLDTECVKKWKRTVDFTRPDINERDLVVFHMQRLSFEVNTMYRVLSKGDRKGKISIASGKFKNLFPKFQTAFADKDDLRFSDLKKKFRKKEQVGLQEMLSLFIHYRIVNLRKHEK